MTTPEARAQINAAMEKWQQGDFFLSENLYFIHLADLARPLTPEAAELASVLGVNYFDRSATIILAGLSEA